MYRGGMVKKNTTELIMALPKCTGGTSQTPVWIERVHLPRIGAEVTAAKENMSYASSSVQALTQALTTELGKDLCHNHIQLRTATTTLNLDDAAADIATKWTICRRRAASLRGSSPGSRNR